MTSYSGGNSNFGGSYVVDVRCSSCGWVGSYASYIQSPTVCSQSVMRGNETVRCGGSIIPVDQGGGIISHRGH